MDPRAETGRVAIGPVRRITHRCRGLVAAVPLLLLAGCGSSVPSSSDGTGRELSGRLAAVQRAASAEDRPAALRALRTFSTTVAERRRTGALSSAQADALRTGIARTRARILAELPATSSTADTTTTAPSTGGGSTASTTPAPVTTAPGSGATGATTAPTTTGGPSTPDPGAGPGVPGSAAAPAAGARTPSQDAKQRAKDAKQRAKDAKRRGKDAEKRGKGSKGPGQAGGPAGPGGPPAGRGKAAGPSRGGTR